MTDERPLKRPPRFRRLSGSALSVALIVTGIVGTIDEFRDIQFAAHPLPVPVFGPALIILGGIVSFLTRSIWKPSGQQDEQDDGRPGPIRWGRLAVIVALRLISVPLLMLPAYLVWGSIMFLVDYHLYGQRDFGKMGPSADEVWSAPIVAAIALLFAWLGGVCLLARPGGSKHGVGSRARPSRPSCSHAEGPLRP